VPDETKPEERAALPDDVRPPDVSMFDAFEQPVQVVVLDSVQPADAN
jgi:hypothetical protein